MFLRCTVTVRVGVRLLPAQPQDLLKRCSSVSDNTQRGSGFSTLTVNRRAGLSRLLAKISSVTSTPCSSDVLFWLCIQMSPPIVAGRGIFSLNVEPQPLPATSMIPANVMVVMVFGIRVFFVNIRW